MKKKNFHGLPAPMVDALLQETYDRSDPNAISVTTLIASPQQVLLADRHRDEIRLDVSDSVLALLGTSLHHIIGLACQAERNPWDDVYVSEERLSVEFDGALITGKPDLRTPTRLYDFKLTTVSNAVNRYGVPSWTEQLNCYAYLIQATTGCKMQRLTVVTILRDWSPVRARRDAEYPQSAAVGIDIELWSLERQIEFLRSRVAAHIASADLPDHALPPCSDEERWFAGDGPDTWAIQRIGGTRASSVHATEAEARVALEAKAESKAGVYYIEHRPGTPGENRYCESYCMAAKFCHQINPLLTQIETVKPPWNVCEK